MVKAMHNVARGTDVIIDAVTSHVAGAATFGGTLIAMVYASAVAVTDLPTVGIGAGGAFLLGMAGLLFRGQQQQIKSLQRQNASQFLRIEHLEHELDQMRGDGR